MKVFPATVAILLFSTACWAEPGQIRKLLPWIDDNNVSLGMTRTEFVESKPAAVQIFIGDKPPPADVAFSGSYVEGDTLKKPGSDQWIYTFKDGHLRFVSWVRKNNSIEADTEQIRRQLMEAYGDPQRGSIARLTTAGKIERVTQECYLTAKSGGFAIYLVATDEGGIEITVMPVSEPEYPAEQFEQSLPKLIKSGLRQNDSKPTLLDILAKISGRN